MKREKHITINLTEQESELIERLAELTERKPAELARILLNRAALTEWGKIQANTHPKDTLHDLRY